MLEIDYDLIPLDQETLAQIERDATILAGRGKVPPLSPSNYGRVLVVNPNQGFDLHHVPNDLRKPLRRSLLPVFEGSRAIAGKALSDQVSAGSDEALHALILELHSEFPTLLEFLRHLPDLRSRHPRCQFLLHTDVLQFYNLLEALIASEGVFVDLFFEHEADAVRVQDVQGLGKVLVELPRYPTFNAPFFEALRVAAGGKAEWYDLLRMKRLYRQYGVGHVEELDVQGKLREKLIVVDLPLAAIESIRFAQTPGASFRAVRIGGEKFYAAQFAEKGIQGQDVPLRDIEAFYRVLPGKEEEEFPLAGVRGVRVNCFDGHVSLLTKPSASYIPLYEVKRLRIAWRDISAGAAAPDLAALAREGQVLEFDRVVATEEGRPRFGELRANIRSGFLERLFRDNLEHQAKLLRFTGRINVACLSPLSAQTFKLLRPYGLEAVIPGDTLYYLGDGLETIERYANLREGLRSMYTDVLARLKAQVTGRGSDGVRPDVITHRLPMVIAWGHDEAPPFERVTGANLEAVYKELQAFIKFCESEFLRLELGQAEGASGYAILADAQATALRVKQLANQLSGRYGHYFTGDTHPDFVFFGSEREFLENSRRCFLPGMAWCELFSHPMLRELFEGQDYEFSVFLEEQIAAMNYLRMQEDPAKAQQFPERYFRSRVEEVTEELRLLEERVKQYNDRKSAVYKQLRETFMREHADELATYTRESQEVARTLERQELEYFDALRQVTAALGDAMLSPEALLAGQDYIGVLDGLLVEHTEGAVGSLHAILRKSGALANRFLQAKLPQLKAFLLTYRDFRQAQFSLLRREFLDGLREEYERVRPRIVDYLRSLQRMKPEQAGALEANLLKRNRLAKDDLDHAKLEMSRAVQDSQKDIAALRDSVSNIAQALAAAPEPADGEQSPAALVQDMEARMNRAEQDIAQVVQAIAAARQSLDTYRLLYRKQRERMVEVFAAENQLAMLERLKNPATAKTARAMPIEAPLLPTPGIPAGAGAEQIGQRVQQLAAALDGVGRKLGDFEKKESFLREARAKLRDYEQLAALQRHFQGCVSLKQRGQHAMLTIATRLEKLKMEAEQLPELVEGRMIPSYKIVCERIYIPNASKRIEHFRKGLVFAQELERLSFDELKRMFMERAIFKRFHGAQFRAGAYFGMNPGMPLYNKLTNVFPALAGFHNKLRARLTKLNYIPKDVTLIKLPAARVGAIIQFCEQQKAMRPEARLTYVALPGTLSLPQALDIILKKDAIFLGLPELLLIFISRFDPRAIRDDEALRERYFRAVKHNIIVNIDDGHLIDNPDVIANRLLEETLGSAFDFPAEELTKVRPLPRDGTPA